MNFEQNGLTVSLLHLMGSPEGWGRVQGQQVRDTLCQILKAHPDTVIFRISLDGVRRTDVPFARESVVELAHNYRRRHGFCLTDISDQDVLDNWDGAASQLCQPLFVWNNGTLFGRLEPVPASGLYEMLEYVQGQPVTRTSEAATALCLKVPNASNKLKSLWIAGYVLRRELSADSGGVEYEYLRIA